LEEAVRLYALDNLTAAIRTEEKLAREEKIAAVKQEVLEHFLEEYPEQEREIKDTLDTIVRARVRQLILEEEIRPDGRGLRDIRPVSCEVGVLPRVHGSGLFTRGQTQVLTALTLGAVSDEQILDGLGNEESKRFMHHYNFPPYSVGEARPMRGPGRREIGHGALAERALEGVIPDETEFPYTIRLVSEVLESNGSSSISDMAGISFIFPIEVEALITILVSISSVDTILKLRCSTSALMLIFTDSSRFFRSKTCLKGISDAKQVTGFSALFDK